MEMILETLENLRREAYVRAVIRKAEFDNVIGYVGEDLPVEIFHAANLTPYPVYGIDREILNFSVEKNICPLIDATVTYAKTDKCPLIHSSKLIVIGKTCPAMKQALQELKDKNIYVYDNEENLISELKKFYSFDKFYGEILYSIRQKLDEISDYIETLHRQNFLITHDEKFTIKYFINFLDIDERMKFLNGLSEKLNEEKSFSRNKFVNLIHHCGLCKGDYLSLDGIFKEEDF